jgi:hypothetical protein
LSTSGVLTLALVDREALIDEKLYLSVYTREHPAGAARAPLLIR